VPARGGACADPVQAVRATRRPVSQPGSPYRWAILAVCVAGFMQTHVHRVGFAPLIPTFIADMGLTYAAAGTIMAAYFWSYAVMQIPVGVFTDHLGARRVMLGCMGVLAVGAVAFSLSQTYAQSLLARCLLGTGAAATWLPGLRLIQEWFEPRERGLATGLFSAGGGVGGTAALLLLPVVFFVGSSTFVRLNEINEEDLTWVKGMNRLRRAYLEIDPGIEPYLITGWTEDVVGVLRTFGAPGGSGIQRPSIRANVMHAFVTTPVMILIVNCVVAAVLVGLVVAQFGMSTELAAVAAVGAFVVTFAAFSAYGARKAAFWIGSEDRSEQG